MAASSHREQHAHLFRSLDSIWKPRVMWITGWIIIASLIMVVCFLVFAPWVQTAAGSGRVIALDPNDRLQEINALVSGRIQQWFVRDGSRVKVGDPIARIIDNDPQLIERLQQEKEQLSAQLQAAESAMTTAEIDYRRTQALLDEGLAAQREFEQARIRFEERKASVAAAAAALTRAEVRLSRGSVQLVRAPRDGVILQVNAGDSATFVSAGDPLASFVPADAGRAVELFIDGRDSALIYPGARVTLQFEGWPVVQFSGWPSIAVGVFDGVVVNVDPSAQPDGRFRVIISEHPEAERAWPDSNVLRYGANARGWVLLERVSVGFEIWRQVNNFPPEFPAHAPPPTF
ncbi:MAG: HlyD family efflux transporter periplasmic adaptor subunit [Pseudomonadota bacterium]